MIDTRTPHLTLPLPHVDNLLEEDVARITASLLELDNHAATTDTIMQTKADAETVNAALQTKADGQATQAALHGKAEQTAVDAALAEHRAVVATTTSTGHLQLATDVEATAGTVTDKAVNPRQLASVRATATDNALPRGLIAMWSGAANAVPQGWALCNGSNGTPNLQDRFIVGAGSSYAVGATGGATSHQHWIGGEAGYTTLDWNMLPWHNHTFGKGTYGSSAEALGSESSQQNTSYAGSSWGHTHSIGLASDARDQRPPYYALCFIMKL